MATIIIIVIIDLYSAITLGDEALAEANARDKTAEMSLAQETEMKCSLSESSSVNACFTHCRAAELIYSRVYTVMSKASVD